MENFLEWVQLHTHITLEEEAAEGADLKKKGEKGGKAAAKGAKGAAKGGAAKGGAEGGKKKVK